MGRSRALAGALLFFSFVLVAVVQSWPLPRSFATALTGPAGGDTGVYVWNIWVFRHEISAGRSPMTTRMIFAPGWAANLSLHNYTVAADLIAWPLQSFLGVVAAFNVVYLLNVALAGLGGYFLARRLRTRDPASPVAAWIAGLTFACSPFLVARSTAHFSLVAAAALPFFAVFVQRTWESGRPSDAMLTGACVAWAMYSDPYYAVYCVLLGLAVVFWRLARIESAGRPPVRSIRSRGLDLLIAAAAVLVGLVALFPGNAFSIGRATISITSLYTPVLVLVVLIVIRLWLRLRPRIVWTGRWPAHGMTSAAVAIGTTLILLAPVLTALMSRVASVGFDSAPVYWRSSAPGVDLLSLFVPNPNHALAPQAIIDWLSREPGRFEENVVAIPWTAIAIIIGARVATGRWASPFWAAVVLAAASLTLGPFVRIGGIETYVPTPWALLRYLPVIGEARMPPRFGVVVVLGVAMLLAGALDDLSRRYPRHRRRLIIGTLLLAIVELMPVPRQIYPATFPSIYTTIRNDPRQMTVLNLPTGMLDGLSGLGKYSAISQFYQTAHGKPIVGGYLSRVSDARKSYLTTRPLVAALVKGSAGEPLTPGVRASALADAAAFTRDASLGYVVIDDARTSEELRQFAIEALRLREVGRDGLLGLFVPELELAGT